MSPPIGATEEGIGTRRTVRDQAMSEKEQNANGQHGKPNDDEQISERNIERLLGTSYEPVEPDASFIDALTDRMMDEAAVQTDAQPSSRGTTEPAKRGWWSRKPLWFGLAAAAAVAFAVSLSIPPQHNIHREGNIVWIDGVPHYADPSYFADGRSHGGSNTTGPRTPWVPAPWKKAEGSGNSLLDIGYKGLTARPRTTKADAKESHIKTGEIKTAAAERRRITLDDGSVLYLNQNTTISVEGNRKVSVKSGEVYVEVSPREPGHRIGNATFVVETPGRKVSALGTKFSVKVGKYGTGVLVTQGKVAVSGYEGLVHAGQQLAPQNRPVREAMPDLTPAPRVSYALDWTKELLAEVESPLVPKSKHGGGSLIAVDPWGQEVNLSLRKFHIDVHIEDGFARTSIDQTYFNHNNWRMEGTFYFPLPPDASLSRLAMYVNGKLMEGGMAERDYARNVFEQIMYTRKDPALLEWVDGSTFKMRVFPLEPRQEKRIVISYTQRLETLYGRTQYRFPSGHNLQLVRDWSFHARVKDGTERRLHWSCESHDLKARPSGKDLALSAEAHKVKVARDVVLDLYDNDQRAQDTGIATFSSAQHEGDRYLMLRYRPHLSGMPKRPRRDWVFLFEASADRDPILARVQVDVARTILENANHDDTFAIVTAGTRVRALTKESLVATPENVKHALAWLEKTHLIGALDLGQAFAACAPYLKAASEPHLVHLGSGVAVLGNRDQKTLCNALPDDTRYVGIGVGKRWARAFMKQAAEKTGGYYTQINPDEQVNWRAFELLSTLNTPRLTNVRVVDNSETVQFLGFSEVLAQGEEIAAIARIPAGARSPKTITITGKRCDTGDAYFQKLSVDDPATGADYLPRQWAKLELDRLVAEGAAKNKQRIIKLSKAMYVMSPFTSLLVLETEQMYKQFKVDRGRKDHWALYPCPEKIPVVYEPDPNWHGWRRPPANANLQAKTKKPTVQQILNTIQVRLAPRPLYDPGRPQGYQGYRVLTAAQLFSGAYANPYAYGYGWGRNWRQIQGRNRMARWAENVEISDHNETDWELDETTVADELITVSEEGAISDIPLGGTGLIQAIGLGGGGGIRSNLRQDVFKSISRSSLAPVMDFRRTASKPMSATYSLDLGSFGGRPSAGEPPGILSREVKRMSKLKEQAGPPRLRLSKDGRGFRFEEEGRKKRAGGKYWNNSVEELSKRIGRGYGQRGLTYQRLQFRGDQRIFTDLLSHAPGMNTTMADIRAVLEAEARPQPSAAPGKIDKEARTLIEKARGQGWQRIVLGTKGEPNAFHIDCDGSGRFIYERTLELGLKETVVCDGQTLWHLYPEIGVGAKRTYSRFHRRDLRALVPWYLPPAEDLARGHDLIRITPNTVAIVPRGVQNRMDKEGRVLPYLRVHLVFAENGRLRERQIVEMPSGKIRLRTTFAPDGKVRVLNAKDELVRDYTLNATAAGAPNLKPKTKDLVVLPLPLRMRNHVMQTRKTNDNRPDRWSEENALMMLAADTAQYGYQVMQTVGRRYFPKGDRRIGFYTLISVSNYNNINPKQEYRYGNVRVQFDVRKDHPKNPLAGFLAENRTILSGSNAKALPFPSGSESGFIARLSAFRNLYYNWQRGWARRGSPAERKAHLNRALKFVRECPVSQLAFGILGYIQNQGGDRTFYQSVADAYRRFESDPYLGYCARYERARLMQNAGQWKESRRLYAALYEDTLKKNQLPRIDYNFRNVFQRDQEGQKEWKRMFEEVSTKLITSKNRSAAILFAWQCKQIGDQPLSERLLADALAGLSPKDEEYADTVLTAIECLFQTGNRPRAETMLDSLLENPEYARSASLWRLGATIAQASGKTAKALTHLENAIDLEYEDLPDVLNLQSVRSDYGGLLNRYQQLANAIHTLQAEPPAEFIGRVIRVADRWRSLDADPTMACQSAARVLQQLGAQELAWDYLTSPLAKKPNEAAPWRAMAQTLRAQANYDLADRAYQKAFEAEPTNAQVLWDRAQSLLQAGRLHEAREVHRQIARGKWQPRFNWLQQQAKRYLGE